MNLSRKKLCCILFLVILASSLVTWQSFVWAISKPSPNRFLDDFPGSVSYKVDGDGSGTFWATRYDGLIAYYGTNSSDIAQAALNASSLAGGGCVYVMPGTYTGSVQLKNQTRLVVESGATGFSFSVAVGAYCDVADWNVARLYHYHAGTLSFDENLDSSVISSLAWVNSTSINSNLWYVNGQNRTDAIANPVGSASYVIDVSGSTYRMINQSTGQVDFSSTNASAVINNAANNLTIGGSIFFKNGFYNLTAPILITHSGTSLIGESCVEQNGEGVELFSSTNDIIQLNCTSTSVGFATLNNIHISKIKFGRWDTPAGGDAITNSIFPVSANRALYNTEIDHCFFKNSGSHHAINIRDFEALHIHDNQMSNSQTSLMYIWTGGYESGELYIERNSLFVENNGGVGIMLNYSAAGGTMVFINENFIAGNAVSAYGVVVNATGNTGDFSIANIHFNGNYYDDAPMLFTHSGSSYIGQVTLDQDKFWSTSSTISYDIAISSKCKQFRIINCEIRGKGIIQNEIYASNEPLVIQNTRFTLVNETAGNGGWSRISDCSPYNPIGVITNPAGNNAWAYILCDKNGTGAILNNTVYTCIESAKNIYISGGAFNGATYNVTVSGVSIFSNLATGPTMMIRLEYGMTILFCWSSPPTIVVIGE